MNNINTSLFPQLTISRPLIIAGPCSAETRQQVLTTATQLSQNGVQIFRAGIWKPRTKPGGFEGVGSVGLEWMREVKEKTGMLLATEVANRAHVEETVAAGIDLLWLGARTSANPFAVQEIADTLAELKADVTVLVKNPVNPDIELWIGALQRIYNAGIRRIGAIHRGFSTYGKHLYRNMPEWHIPIELRLRYPSLPIICDPSHIGGKRELIAPLSQQAMDMAFDGLIIETHCSPEDAWSDAEQQITPEVLNLILGTLVIRDSKQTTESLSMLRQKIDRLDNELLEILAKRMNVSREIGRYKQEHKMSVVQAGRYNDVMRSRVKLGEEMGMGADFLRTVLLAIHDESVRQQIEVINKHVL
ncbi:MAG: bifunctional 3-deoxy-7-phosphoheptulonate synthase/chorismate mutase type II [Firmicutes bacterium]|nr:bifunctional 3-deoxy-7-phosphoheptulonate synthase/chorismate mutase type II [Bacillota bacterium]MCM1401116.1 bifunctional 3-deoxy-7-phosphoheptulonate synthase/chorismate mutase type II [Bacteroides sp.]MCM1477061.1 bifunctional 3-deoxy-7-phosphoheptulonate synthase/chorismate mutase type II [Bacteroides sp.]